MIQHVRPRLEMVENERKYWEFIRQVRNNEAVKSGFIQQQPITTEQQSFYMSIYSHCFFICLCDGEPAGYVGVIDKDIRIAVHPDFQRQGIASFMLEFLKRNDPTAVAKIKVDNEASLRTFQKAGYKIKYYLLELDKDNTHQQP